MTLEYLLKLSAGQFIGPLDKARDAQGRFIAQTKQMSASGTRDVNNLGGAFTGLATKIAAAFTAWKAGEAVFSGFKKSLGLAADAETTATAFKTLVGSAELANDTLAKVKNMADTTPFQFPELAGAARMLVAFGESAKDIPDTLRRLGDVASGVAAPVGEIAEIYGKARTQGQLFAEDINQLTGRGIPIIKALADVLGKPESAIKKLGEEGKITFPLIDQAFRNMTASGGQFYHMMEEQAGTTNGLLSTLEDGVNSLFLEFGKPLNDAIKPILTDAIDLAEQLKPVIADVGVHMGVALGAVRDFISEAKDGSGMASSMGNALWEMLQKVASKMMVPFEAAWAGMASLGNDLIEWLKPVGGWLAATLESAAMSFGRTIMKQLAEVFESLPMHMGEAAAKSLNKSATAASQAASVANRHAKNAEKKIEAPTAKGAANSLDKAAGATRGVLGGYLDKANAPSPFALPPSSLNKDYNPMFPGGVLPPGAKAGKGTLAPSALDAPGPGGVPNSMLNGFVASPAAKDAGGKAVGVDKAIAGVNAPKEDKGAEKKAEQQKKFLNYEQKESEIMKALVAGDTARAAALKQQFQVLKETDAIKEKGGVTDDKALAQAREKVALQEKYKALSNAPMVPAAVKKGMAASGDDGPRKIHGYSQSQGGRMMGGKTGPLSAPGPKRLPSPGAAKASQSRREAATTAARSGGGGGTHPLMAMIKDMQNKLNSLAVAK